MQYVDAPADTHIGWLRSRNVGVLSVWSRELIPWRRKFWPRLFFDQSGWGEGHTGWRVANPTAESTDEKRSWFQQCQSVTGFDRRRNGNMGVFNELYSAVHKRVSVAMFDLVILGVVIQELLACACAPSNEEVACVFSNKLTALM